MSCRAEAHFELQLHPIPANGILTQAQAIWPIETAMEAFQWYYEWQQTAPFSWRLNMLWPLSREWVRWHLSASLIGTLKIPLVLLRPLR